MWSDLRYAFRSFQKTPALTVILILTLALGIGANTAIFSVIDAVLLRPTPLRNLDRLAMVWETDRNTILFYSSSGERVGRTQLVQAPVLAPSLA